MKDTDKAIMALGKALREVNNLPVYAGENILEIRKIKGQDGIVRELIIVDKLATRHVYNREDVSDDVRRFNRGTWEIQRTLDGFDPKTMRCIYKAASLRSITATLRKGVGSGRGIVTDRNLYRFDK